MSYGAIMSFFLTINLQSDLTDIPCSDCHSSDGWEPLSSTMIFNHDNTDFQLEGNHRGTECIQCHPGNTMEEIHNFTHAETECQTCHMDIHYGLMGTDCQTCHGFETWDMSNWKKAYEHLMFPLLGAHALIECSTCHGEDLVQYSGSLSNDCLPCHTLDYNQALATSSHSENTNCILCHNTHGWSPADMSHHDFLFPIYSGEHRGEWSTCEAECHINSSDYSVFSCGLNGVCHDHRQTEMDDEHDDESGYVYESSACFNCHPQGKEDD